MALSGSNAFGWSVRLVRRLWPVCLLLCLALPARADVWAYVDEKGVAHFAVERVDDRYELFFRNAESFDTTKDAAEPEPAHGPMPVPATPSKLLNFFEVSPTFKLVRQNLRDASSDHNIDFELLQALIATESGFNSGAVSPKGAIGLMQILPATARRYGVDGDRKLALETKLTDPKINIRTGSTLNGLEVCFESIGCKLHTIRLLQSQQEKWRLRAART